MSDQQPAAKHEMKTSTAGIIDSHAHVVKEFFKEEQDEVIERTFATQVTLIVNPGVVVEDIPELQELAAKHKSIFIAAGQHPHEAKFWSPEHADKVREALKDPKVVAVGECGLDFHYNNSDRESQLKAFAEQIRIAREHKKPVIVHCRDAWHEAFDLLTEEGGGQVKGVFHCFTGGPEVLPQIEKLDFYVSFSGIVTFPNAKEIQAAAPLVKAERILVETDCPFLAPQKARGKRNEPAYVWHVADKLAELRGTSLDEIARITSENARRLFNLPLN
jgi:TatD DNase family protein